MRYGTSAGGLVVIVMLLNGGAVNADGAGPQPESAAAPLFPFVLPWDDDRPGVTDLSGWLDRPAGRHGPVVTRDGHLYAGPDRLRLFGVNLCFGANVPRPEDAEKVAARLAKLGINCVRFHHMDSQRAPNGLLAADGRTLDPGQLDRLDHLIARLKERGIYADLNLHVSRNYPDAPPWPDGPSFFKGVDNFVPRLIAWQRQYARDLLTHRNAYTNSRYADEPAVALVEINNENGLLSEWWGGRLDEMPEPYAAELARQWNAWLEARYPDAAALRTAWGAKDEPLGAEMLVNGDFAQGQRPWLLEQHGTARAAVRAAGDPKGVRIEVRQPGQQNWHVQWVQGAPRLRGDQPYTLAFRARADGPTRIRVNAMQAHAPWQHLWSAEVPLTTAWKEFRFTFEPSESEDDARITFTGFGARAGAVELAEASLPPGGALGLAPGEAPGKIAIVRKRDFASRTAAAQRDWIRFLYEVERRYWTGMARFLKEDLGVKGLVVGTQMGWSPFPIQAQLDVIDSHAYWQHPEFPGRPWDPANWTVANIPMTGAADGGTLPRLALSRVAGKPFLCTEYNHAAPNTYGSEAFLLLSAFAAVQDWDGLFAFAYSHRCDDWDRGQIPSFFDIDQHPTKLVTLAAASALFRRGDLLSPRGRVVAPADHEQVIEALRRSGPRALGAGTFGVSRAEALRGPVGVTLPGAAAGSAAAADPAPRGRFSWWRDGPGVVTIAAPRSKAVIGSIDAGPFDLDDGVIVAPEPNRQGWAAITLTVMEGTDFSSPGRLLVTATGYAENTAMGWKDAAQTSVGRDWGRRPSLVEGIPATITLPVAAARIRAWSLDERGGRRDEVAARPVQGHALLAIGPEHRTLWYEIEIGPGR
ncbi:MAG TPA: carbohydrate binding domain-containing protein [Isosphaeraceae bacterium]|jgi:hypothetical protein